jgi:hypothetical protein
MQRVESSDRVEIRAPRGALIIDRLRPGVFERARAETRP